MGDDALINEAIKVARRSTHKKHMTGAVIVSPSDEIVSNGWAHTGSWRMRELYSMHAELHAIYRARHARRILHECQIYVATIARSSGAITSAKPCITCAAALLAVGIDTVHYTCYSSALLGNKTLTCYLPDDLSNLKVYSRPCDES